MVEPRCKVSKKKPQTDLSPSSVEIWCSSCLFVLLSSSFCMSFSFTSSLSFQTFSSAFSSAQHESRHQQCPPASKATDMVVGVACRQGMQHKSVALVFFFHPVKMPDTSWRGYGCVQIHHSPLQIWCAHVWTIFNGPRTMISFIWLAVT